jgi:hypothetical protein
VSLLSFFERRKKTAQIYAGRAPTLYGEEPIIVKNVQLYSSSSRSSSSSEEGREDFSRANCLKN